MEKAASDKQKLTLDGKTYKMKYGLQKRYIYGNSS